MKHKVSELSGALLDAAVAKALGWKVARVPEQHGGGLDALDVERQQGHLLHDTEELAWSPSRRWEHGGLLSGVIIYETAFVKCPGCDAEYMLKRERATEPEWTAPSTAPPASTARTCRSASVGASRWCGSNHRMEATRLDA